MSVRTTYPHADRRGSMLVVALLVLLALSSIGMVIVQKVQEELTYAGNNRRGVTAYHVTESGVYTTLALSESLGPGGFLAVFADAAVGDGNEPAMGLTPDDIVALVKDDQSTLDTYFDLDSKGSFGFEGSSAKADAAIAAAAKAPFAFDVNVASTQMIQPLIGFSLEGPSSRCRFRYRFDSDGTIADRSVDAGGGRVFEARKIVRALVNIAPLPCTRAAGTVGTM